MYDIILFDLDDTLLDFSRSESLSLKNIHMEFYSSVDLEAFEQCYKEINTALWARVGALQNPLKPGDIKLMRFEQMNSKLGCAVEAKKVATVYEASLGENAHWYPGAMAMVDFLHQKGHILGIVTNGLVGVQTRKYDRHQLGNWFDCYIISDAVGHAKPQRDIFDCALKEISMKRNQSGDSLMSSSMLMVGDTLLSDGHGAMQFGIDFCFINHKQVVNTAPDLVIKHEIHLVTELPNILGYKEEFHF